MRRLIELSIHGGIAPLRKNSQTLLKETGKANALNDRVQSVFSPKNPIRLKSLAQKSLQDLHDSGTNTPFQPSPHPEIPYISIATEGIGKLLVSLSPQKAAGPEKFKLIVLQTLHKELGPILQFIFQRCLDTGKLHLERGKCFLNFQKGEQSDPSNYRPISLNCVLCKILEHIVASKMAKHFTKLDILYDLQHGFREKRSCETQHIMLVDELAEICRWANRLILFSWT